MKSPKQQSTYISLDHKAPLLKLFYHPANVCKRNHYYLIMKELQGECYFCYPKLVLKIRKIMKRKDKVRWIGF